MNFDAIETSLRDPSSDPPQEKKKLWGPFLLVECPSSANVSVSATAIDHNYRSSSFWRVSSVPMSSFVYLFAVTTRNVVICIGVTGNIKSNDVTISLLQRKSNAFLIA